MNVCAAFASGVVSAAIGDDGSLWVWGKSKRGQLGLGKGIIEAVVPSRVEALSREKIAKVASFLVYTCLKIQYATFFFLSYILYQSIVIDT